MLLHATDDCYLDENGLLCHIWTSGKGHLTTPCFQLVALTALCHKTLLSVHDSPLGGGHLGVIRPTKKCTNGTIDLVYSLTFNTSVSGAPLCNEETLLRQCLWLHQCSKTEAWPCSTGVLGPISWLWEHTGHSCSDNNIFGLICLLFQITDTMSTT